LMPKDYPDFTFTTHVRTLAADNIVIDKLKVGAYTEDRRTLSNNGAAASWSSVTGDLRRGKFFPRGCRGFIDKIDVYCKDAGTTGGTIIVYISPHPKMGYVAGAGITVPAGADPAWRSADFRLMWNYDSLFIFVVASSIDIVHGYDTGEPYDSFASDNAGETWRHEDCRRWFRVVMKGQTVGDIPVSGTLNTIKIPSILAAWDHFSGVNLDGGSEATVINLNGAGELIRLQVYLRQSLGTVEPEYMELRLTVDGKGRTIAIDDFMRVVGEVANSISPVSMSKIDTVNNMYQVSFNFSIPFKRNIRLTIRNRAAAGNKIDYDGFDVVARLD